MQALIINLAPQAAYPTSLSPSSPYHLQADPGPSQPRSRPRATAATTITTTSAPSTMPPPSTIPASRKRKSCGPPAIAPAPSSTSLSAVRPKPSSIPAHVQSSPSVSTSSLDQDGDDEYVPSSAAAGKAGSRQANGATANGSKRKTPSTSTGTPGNTKMTKMSREALRKANHSLIERRRREKINSALGELRGMVPGLGEDGGGKGGEFKLEVLERTVDHMKLLKRHIQSLEAALKAHGIELSSTLNSDDPYQRDDDQDDEQGDELKAPGDYEERNRPRETYEGHGQMDIDETHQSGSSTMNGSKLIFSTHAAHLQEHPHQHSPYPSPSPDVLHDTLSPDPNETEVESDLPPPLTKAAPRPGHRSEVELKSKPYSRPHAPYPGHRHTRSESDSASGYSKPGSPYQSSAPSVASLLASAHRHSPTPSSISRPPPPPQANNPIFLPFPAPSPTSPFMNSMTNEFPKSLNGLNADTTSNSTSGSAGDSGPPDPSPFLAPMSGMSLFGGVISLDPVSPIDSMRPYSASHSHSYSHSSSSAGNGSKSNSPPHLSLPPPPAFSTSSSVSVNPSGSTNGTSAKDMPAEEAANLLLAFSSPDTLRPTEVVLPIPNFNVGMGIGKAMFNNNGKSFGDEMEKRERQKGPRKAKRSTADSRESQFSLDSASGKGQQIVGKSAGDILRMTEFQR